MRLNDFRPFRRGAICAFGCLALTASAVSQLQAQPAKATPTRNRIVSAINNQQRVALPGHVHPRLAAARDEGAVDPSLPLPRVTMTLKPSDAQQADLDQLLADQQNPASPNYHRWLAPEEYAARFGVSQSDIDKIVAWLQSQNLSVTAVGRGHAWIAAEGKAADVQAAFGTSLRRYRTEDGELHFANATDPTIPAAIQNVVRAIRGLNDFRLKPARHSVRPFEPNYNNARGAHSMSPGDFSIIYNTKSLYNAGINGTGQKIAVVGQTQVKMADMQLFRTSFGLPANDAQTVLVPNTRDPGILKDDMVEADLDIQWAGAIAPNATIVYVYSYDVMDSVQYVVDQNLAPVISMSYGSCELENLTADASDMQALAKRANAQGITWTAASGDDGGPDCGSTSRYTSLSVDLPAGVPEVTGIGGTTFNEGTSTYWSLTNDSSRVSALSYIPEIAWNDTAVQGSAASSGGGASRFYPKPSWQVGPGVPDNSARNVPDISLSASNNHIGYLIINNGAMSVIGGTSAGAPSFAGIVALINQYTSTNGQGNVNPRLYQLAQTTPSAFHDITSGDNLVSPCAGKKGCTATAIGYSAGAGYDQVTGLGSIDAFNLVNAWRASASVTKSSTQMQLSANASSVTVADKLQLVANVSGANGGALTGSVQFLSNAVPLGSALILNNAATLNMNAAQLPVGDNTITAQYAGDAGYTASTAATTVSVRSFSSGVPSVAGTANGASFKTGIAPGMLLSIFGSNLAPAAQAAYAIPLPSQLAGTSVTINGLTAPLYYVSAGQLNVQVPYEIDPSAPATLVIDNNGQTTTRQLTLTAVSPGIFTDSSGAPVPNVSGRAGQILTLFVTGAGVMSPVVSSGSAPDPATPIANLPRPTQAVSVTVGGAPATVQFAGNPAGLVGLIQINYQVPANTPAGVRPVVVTVGGTASAPVNLTVTP